MAEAESMAQQKSVSWLEELTVLALALKSALKTWLPVLFQLPHLKNSAPSNWQVSHCLQQVRQKISPGPVFQTTPLPAERGRREARVRHWWTWLFRQQQARVRGACQGPTAGAQPECRKRVHAWRSMLGRALLSSG